MRVLASGAPPACAKPPRGSKPLSSNAPGPPPARRPATCRRNSIAYAPVAAPKKAIGAIAASILTAVYEMLKTGALYDDLGSHHFDKRGKGKQIHRLVSRLQNLGFAVQITPVPAVA